MVSFRQLATIDFTGDPTNDLYLQDSLEVSSSAVPLTIIKGAGHEYIPLPTGDNATVADFHSIRTNTTDSPSHLTSGFYEIEAGPAKPAAYNFEETKYVLSGQIDVLVNRTEHLKVDLVADI